MPDGSSAESAFTFISEGTTYADTGWLCTTDAPNDIVGRNSTRAGSVLVVPARA